MKLFFTHTGGKIFRFFWSWGFLKFVLVFATLIVLLYAEEDWRGARAWAATKARWEARGETFDLSKFTPPPIPDDQNLAAIPLFKVERVEYAPGKFDPRLNVLMKALRSSQGPGNDLPARGNWMRGELPDLQKMRGDVAKNFVGAFKDTNLPPGSLAQWEALYPFVEELRAASETRPYFRPPEDYTISPPAGRALGNLTQAIRMSQVLTIDAFLALDSHHADQALEDIKINYKLLAGAKRDPSLVGGLVAIGVNAISGGALYDGFALHAWNDAQLAEIDQMLEPINFLSDYQFAYRSEAAVTITNIDYFKNGQMRDIYQLFGLPRDDAGVPLAFREPFPWPSGWWDQNKAQLADLTLSQLASVDPQAQRVFAQVTPVLEHQLEVSLNRWDAKAPWNIWYTLAAGPLGNFDQKYAYAQSWINESRLACALERYRLVHGVYPDSLDVLAPSYINFVPHDVINGESYHYHLRPEGVFLLYSVGWNQTDDGGKIVFAQDAPTKIDNKLGDWVWPTPIYPKP